MTFSKPTPLAKALSWLRSKKLVPTWLGSEDLRSLAADVKRQALFSARMTQLRPLQALKSGLDDMLSGTGNLADAKLKLAKVYTSMGYDAEKGGFPQDKEGTVPPAVKGTLKDLASQKRMALTITTQYRMATNAAFITRGNDEQRLYQWPALELVRIGRRNTPRGFARRKGGLVPDPGQDWPSRFVAAGGELYDRGTRMIALKGANVWQALGDGVGGYEDTLHNPFAPFAYGSGYGLREVPRREALMLGVLDPESKAAAMPEGLKKSLQADAQDVDPALLKAFSKDLVKKEDGRVRLRDMLAKELEAADASYQGRSTRNRAQAVLDVLTNRKPSPLQRRCKAVLSQLQAAGKEAA